jgi:hypothetical protein
VDLASPEVWISLLTLTALEIVLGIDNVVFISTLTGKLPPELRKRAPTIGLSLAMIIRILLLLSLSWIIKLTDLLRDDQRLRRRAPDGKDPRAELPAADWHVACRGRPRPAHLEGLHLLRDGLLDLRRVSQHPPAP